MSGIPCPRCDTPIPDVAYVCARCSAVLAVALRHAASLWGAMEDAVARQTAMAGSSTPPRKPRALEGPVCVSCHHDSCLPVRTSRLRTTWTEDPIPGETWLVNLTAMEAAWDVTNTATTWARLVAEESGRPIPPETPREPRRVLVQRKRYTVVPADRPDRCDYSDLPIDTCACGHSHERTTV